MLSTVGYSKIIFFNVWRADSRGGFVHSVPLTSVPWIREPGIETPWKSHSRTVEASHSFFPSVCSSSLKTFTTNQLLLPHNCKYKRKHSNRSYSGELRSCPGGFSGGVLIMWGHAARDLVSVIIHKNFTTEIPGEVCNSVTIITFLCLSHCYLSCL